MTVYVDDAYIPAKLPGMRPAIWCHMTADTKEELHAFAASIGLRRSWFQDKPNGHWHYDVTKTVRAKAMKAGAIEIGTGLDAFREVWHRAGREGVKDGRTSVPTEPEGADGQGPAVSGKDKPNGDGSSFEVSRGETPWEFESPSFRRMQAR